MRGHSSSRRRLQLKAVCDTALRLGMRHGSAVATDALCDRLACTEAVDMGCSIRSAGGRAWHGDSDPFKPRLFRAGDGQTAPRKHHSMIDPITVSVSTRCWHTHACVVIPSLRHYMLRLRLAPRAWRPRVHAKRRRWHTRLRGRGDGMMLASAAQHAHGLCELMFSLSAQLHGGPPGNAPCGAASHPAPFSSPALASTGPASGWHAWRTSMAGQGCTCARLVVHW